MALIVLSQSIIGCRKTAEELMQVPKPIIWERMSPAQKEYYEGLNTVQKKAIAAYTSKPEQWQAFLKKWAAHNKGKK